MPACKTGKHPSISAAHKNWRPESPLPASAVTYNLAGPGGIEPPKPNWYLFWRQAGLSASLKTYKTWWTLIDLNYRNLRCRMYMPGGFARFPKGSIETWCVLKESNLLPTSHLIMATVLQTASGDRTQIKMILMQLATFQWPRQVSKTTPLWPAAIDEDIVTVSIGSVFVLYISIVNARSHTFADYAGI